MASEPPTLEAIAKLAGVSRVTVSRVLNGKTKETWPSTARRAGRIRRIARRLGYRPNAAARATVSGRFGSVSLVVSTELGRSHLPSQLLFGVHDALIDRDIQLIIGRLPDAEGAERGAVPRILREWCCDGMLINYTTHIAPEIVELIEGQNVPCVWLNAKRPADCVYPDDLAAGRMATEHLLEAGHMTITYVCGAMKRQPGPWAHYSVQDRRDGYEEAMRSAGLEPELLMRDKLGSSAAGREAYLVSLMQHQDRPSAVVTYSGDDAENVYAAARAASLQVPRDLSIVAVSDDVVSGTGPGLTTVVVPFTAVGRAGVKMLMARIDGGSAHLPAKTIPPTLHEGGSIAAPSSER